MDRLAILATTLLLVATLVWASLFYFRFTWAPDRRKPWYKLTIYACLVIHAVTIGLSPLPHPALIAVGLLLGAISLGLFWSAVWAHHHQRPAFAFVQVAPETLVRRGPYRFVRHPFYLAFLVAALAGMFLSGQIALVLTVVWLGVFYYWAAREEEARFLRSEFAAQYEQYQSQTGMFFPRLLRPRSLPCTDALPSVTETKQP